MSTQNVTPEEDPLREQAELLLDIHGSSVDWYQRRLVNMANDAGLEIGVTLAIEGQVITGHLISGRKFFDETADLLAKAIATPEGEADMRQALLQGTEQYYGESDKDDDSAKRPPSYLHMRDAKIFSPGQPPLPEIGGGLWRGRINSVSAWSLGVITRQSAAA